MRFGHDPISRGLPGGDSRGLFGTSNGFDLSLGPTSQALKMVPNGLLGAFYFGFQNGDESVKICVPELARALCMLFGMIALLWGVRFARLCSDRGCVRSILHAICGDRAPAKSDFHAICSDRAFVGRFACDSP